MYRIKDFLRGIKYAYQRVVRGWDDRAAWSFCDHVARQAVEILPKIIEQQDGVSFMFCRADESFEEGMAKQMKMLTDILDGFQAFLDANNHENGLEEDGTFNPDKYMLELKKYEKKYENGLKLFAKYFTTLWT